MKITLNKQQLEDFLDYRLEKRKANKSTGAGNAFYYSDSGEIEALEDIKNLLALFGEDFVKQGRDVARKKVAEKNPHYNPAQDKANGDSWWLSGYVNTMKEFGVTGLKQ